MSTPQDSDNPDGVLSVRLGRGSYQVSMDHKGGLSLHGPRGALYELKPVRRANGVFVPVSVKTGAPMLLNKERVVFVVLGDVVEVMTLAAYQTTTQQGK